MSDTAATDTTPVLHINDGGGQRLRRKTLPRCPVCELEGDIAIVEYGTASPWYCPVWTCTNCGDSWSDGQLMERPFQRGWRARSVAQALRDWDRGCECPPVMVDRRFTACVHDLERQAERHR